MKNYKYRQAGKRLVLVLALLIVALFLPFNMQAADQRIVLSDEDRSGETIGSSGINLSTEDEGRLIVSAVLSGGSGGQDISLTKIGKDGKVSWTKTYGESGDEVARSIMQTSDGGFIITGYTTSKGSGGRDLYMLRLNKWGDKQWDAAVGGTNDDEGLMVQQLNGGDFVAVGYSLRQHTVSGSQAPTQDADIMAVRYDRNGKKIWERYYGGNQDDYACSIQANKNGGLVIAGCTRSFSKGTWDIYVIKMIDSGLVSWEKSIGGTANYISTGIQQTPDNGYLVMGYTYDESSAQRQDVRIRLDSSGKLLWQQTLDDLSLYGDAMHSTLTTVDADANLTTKSDNALPPPQIPQAKQSRKGSH
ncbi:MAG: hypothetical protein GXY49_03350 [Syntrophomonadaceae bacterium]|nr:hypothetical protein [Syntrophomonadaceae bacterium]